MNVVLYFVVLLFMAFALIVTVALNTEKSARKIFAVIYFLLAGFSYNFIYLVHITDAGGYGFFMFLTGVFLCAGWMELIGSFVDSKSAQSQTKREGKTCKGGLNKECVRPISPPNRRFKSFLGGERFVGFAIEGDDQDDTNPSEGGSGIPKK